MRFQRLEKLWHYGQQLSSGSQHTQTFLEDLLQISDVFEDIEADHEVKAVGGKRKVFPEGRMKLGFHLLSLGKQLSCFYVCWNVTTQVAPP